MHAGHSRPKTHNPNVVPRLFGLAWSYKFDCLMALIIQALLVGLSIAGLGVSGLAIDVIRTQSNRRPQLHDGRLALSYPPHGQACG